MTKRKVRRREGLKKAKETGWKEKEKYHNIIKISPVSTTNNKIVASTWQQAQSHQFGFVSIYFQLLMIQFGRKIFLNCLA